MDEQTRLTGQDQAYLRDVQYGDTGNFAARANLHRKYGTAPVKWRPWVAQQISWPDTAEVLEVGCGPGWLWAEAAELLPPGLRLTLTDLSPGMVDSALAQVRDLARFSSVEGREADVQQLPFEDDAFDVVVANHMLYHVPDPAGAVAELARVLRPNGVLLAATIGSDHLAELWEILIPVFGELPADAAELLTTFSAATGRPLLETCFANVERRDYDNELRCTDPEDVLAYLKSLPPANEAPPAKLDTLSNAIRDRFAAGDGVLAVQTDLVLFINR